MPDTSGQPRGICKIGAYWFYKLASRAISKEIPVLQNKNDPNSNGKAVHGTLRGDVAHGQ
jgi:hypothetical protein